MDRGVWWAAVHGVAKSQTRLSNFTFTFHCHALEKEMATHSSVLAWRIPGMAEPGGLPSMGSHRVRHDWSDLATAAAATQVQWREHWSGRWRYQHISSALLLAYFVTMVKSLLLASVSSSVQWRMRIQGKAQVPSDYSHIWIHRALYLETWILGGQDVGLRPLDGRKMLLMRHWR